MCVICGLLNKITFFFFPLHHSQFMTRTVHKKLVTSKALLCNPNKQDLTERAYNKHRKQNTKMGGSGGVLERKKKPTKQRMQ